VSQVVKPELILKSYSKRKLFGLEVQKDCFVDRTTTKDLADRTAQKQ